MIHILIHFDPKMVKLEAAKVLRPRGLSPQSSLQAQGAPPPDSIWQLGQLGTSHDFRLWRGHWPCRPSPCGMSHWPHPAAARRSHLPFLLKKASVGKGWQRTQKGFEDKMLGVSRRVQWGWGCAMRNIEKPRIFMYFLGPLPCSQWKN